MADHVFGAVTLSRQAGVDRYVLRSDGGAVLQDRVCTAEESTAITHIENADDLRAKGLAYLGLASPTQAQTTRAVRALVMLALQALDDTTGT